MAGIYSDDPLFTTVVRNLTGITRLIAGITLEPYERCVVKFYDKDEVVLALRLQTNGVIEMDPQPTIDEQGNFAMYVHPATHSADMIVDGVNNKVFTTQNKETLILLNEGYVHTQTIPSDTWVISHPFDRHPAVTIVDPAGMQVIGDVRYAAHDKVVILFSTPFSGSAYLN